MELHSNSMARCIALWQTPIDTNGGNVLLAAPLKHPEWKVLVVKNG